MAPQSQPSARDAPSTTPPNDANAVRSTSVPGPVTPPAGMTVPQSTLHEHGESLAENDRRGVVMGPYELLGELGCGGMGIVYRARHTGLDRVVALKTMRTHLAAQPEQVERFDREMRIAARLDHPNVVPIYEIGRHEGRPFYAMPYMPGGSLTEQRARLHGDPRAALALMEKVARAVEHAHTLGIVHRDLKPGNVLLDEHGEPRVGDFGLAKVRDSDAELTQTGAVLGTPAYMAPEQAAGRVRDVGPATDVWALGVMLYELLTGCRPFVGASGEEVKRQILSAEPAPVSTLRPELGPALADVLRTCLEKDPQRRYATAAALADDLGRCLRGERPLVRPETLRRRLGRDVRRHPVRSAALALVVMALAALAVIAVVREVQRPDAPMTLIGASGGPAEFRWLAGGKGAAVVEGGPDAPFTLRTDRLTLVELLAQPRWEHYRLEAELRHDAATDAGGIGIFLAHHEYGSANGQYHCLWKLGFMDQGSRAGRASLAVWRYDERITLPIGYAVPGPAQHFQPAVPGVPPPWRHVAVELTVNGLQAFFEGNRISDVPLADVHAESARVIQGIMDIQADFCPKGPLGIYLQEGTGAFRNVVCRPLP